VRYNGVNAVALIDTGADVSIISETLWRSCGAPIQIAGTAMLKALDGTRLYPTCCTEMTLQLGETQQAVKLDVMDVQDLQGWRTVIDSCGTVLFGNVGVQLPLIATTKYRSGIVMSIIAETTSTDDQSQKQVAEVLNLVQLNYQALTGFEEAVRECLARNADRFKTKFTPLERTSTLQHHTSLEEKAQPSSGPPRRFHP
jgi:hypothetical protein